jgi:hypothetical protein
MLHQRVGAAPLERDAVSLVAQICNLLYRRFVICKAPECSRHDRLQICATPDNCASRILIPALALSILGSLTSRASQNPSTNQTTVIIVVGAAGEAEFGTNFLRQAGLWESACQQAHCHEITLGLNPEGQTNDFETLKQTLASEPKAGPDELWLVLIGHGTFDGKEARFNLRGPDVSATELALWLQPFHRPLAVINTTSSSAPFLNKLSAANRVVITATRSGNEQNFTRFGQYLAETINDPQADLDKDGQVSLLEAFLMASRRTSEFYKTDGRIITEHALLDDSGDGLGTPADWFRGLRAVKRPKEDAPVDGLLARQFHLLRSPEDQKLSPDQRVHRDKLERAILQHREKKDRMSEEDYYHELEKLLLDLARISESSPPTQGGSR